MANAKGFTEKSVKRIASAVRAVEAMSKPIKRGKPQPARLSHWLPQLGTISSTCNKGNSATVTIYTGTTAGSETSAGWTVSAYNAFGDITVTTTKWVWVQNNGFLWYITAAECA